MKKLLFTIALAGIVMGVGAFNSRISQTIKALEQIGVSPEAASDAVWYSLSSGYLNYPASVAKLKQVAAGQRGSAIREIAEFARRYVQTDEFKKKYLEYRENKKPAPPDQPKSAAEQRKEQKAQLDKSLKETQDAMNAAPESQKEMYKGIIAMFKEQQKQLDDPNNPMFSKDMDAMLKQGYESSMQEYKEKVAEWEKEYPTDPKPMIRKWLTQFLAETKDVDFSAALKQGQYGRKEFANAAYESKSSNWKLCYRAGKETVEAGRAAAQQWLKELQ